MKQHIVSSPHCHHSSAKMEIIPCSLLIKGCKMKAEVFFFTLCSSVWRFVISWGLGVFLCQWVHCFNFYRDKHGVCSMWAAVLVYHPSNCGAEISPQLNQQSMCLSSGRNHWHNMCHLSASAPEWVNHIWTVYFLSVYQIDLGQSIINQSSHMRKTDFDLFVDVLKKQSESSVVVRKKALGFCVCSLCVVPVPVWVPPGCSDFLPQSKDMQVRWISDCKVPMGVNETVCLPLYVLICDLLSRV